MNKSDSTNLTFAIPETTAASVRTALGADVSKYAIFLATTVTMVHRYTGHKIIKVNVKTSSFAAVLEMDVASTATTVNDLLLQSQQKLKGFCDPSADTDDMTFELSGEIMRPVMRIANESADSVAMLILRCNAAGNEAVCDFTYSKKYFSADLIRQMVRHFNNIFLDITNRPTVPMNDIAMLDAEERAVILERGIGPIVEVGKKCAHRLFEEQAANNPKAPALIHDKKVVSFEELNSRANDIGCFLQSLGVGSGSVIGIAMERCTEAIVCILAAFKTGATYAIVNPEYPAARIEEMLSDAQIRLLITKSSLKPVFNCEGVQLIDYSRFSDRPKENTANVVSDVALDDAAYITFTSGSTGKPKGIVGTTPVQNSIKPHKCC